MVIAGAIVGQQRVVAQIRVAAFDFDAVKSVLLFEHPLSLSDLSVLAVLVLNRQLLLQDHGVLVLVDGTGGQEAAGLRHVFGGPSGRVGDSISRARDARKLVARVATQGCETRVEIHFPVSTECKGSKLPLVISRRLKT